MHVKTAVRFCKERGACCPLQMYLVYTIQSECVGLCQNSAQKLFLNNIKSAAAARERARIVTSPLAFACPPVEKCEVNRCVLVRFVAQV